jgi:hypothetical protein
MMHGATNPEGEAPTTTKPATDTDAGTIERGRRDKPVRVGGGGGGIECGAAHKSSSRSSSELVGACLLPRNNQQSTTIHATHTPHTHNTNRRTLPLLEKYAQASSLPRRHKTNMPGSKGLATPAGASPTEPTGALPPANDCAFAALPAAMHIFMTSFVKTSDRLEMATTSHGLLELWGSSMTTIVVSRNFQWTIFVIAVSKN